MGNMKRAFVVAAVLPLLFLCSGCYRTVYRGEDLPFSAEFNRIDPSKEVMVSHFQEDKWNHYFLFALVPTSEPDLKALIARDVPAGCAVRNLQIRHECTFVNAVVWLLVGGLYNPMTTTVSGDIVRVQTPTAALLTPGK
jgi:hypothetical protein